MIFILFCVLPMWHNFWTQDVYSHFWLLLLIGFFCFAWFPSFIFGVSHSVLLIFPLWMTIGIYKQLCMYNASLLDITAFIMNDLLWKTKSISFTNNWSRPLISCQISCHLWSKPGTCSAMCTWNGSQTSLFAKTLSQGSYRTESGTANRDIFNKW